MRRLFRGDASGRHNLAPATCSRQEGEVRPRQPKGRGKELEEGVVRGAIDWRCGDPDPQLSTMEANDFIAGGPWLHPNGDARAGAVLAEGRQ